MNDYSILQLGDQAVTMVLEKPSVSGHKKILAVRNWLLENPFEGMLDIVAAYSSLTVVYDVFQLQSTAEGNCHAFVTSQLRYAFDNYGQTANASAEKIKTVPVCYDDPYAPDLPWVCESLGIAKERLIDLHISRTYLVYAIGFLPGFPYMGEVDPDIRVSRKERPRTLVPAGSVGLAGVQTGIYPVDSPGGWQIVGRTPLVLFDKDRDPPVLLEAGDEVRFLPVSQAQFDAFPRSIQ